MCCRLAATPLNGWFRRSRCKLPANISYVYQAVAMMHWRNMMHEYLLRRTGFVEKRPEHPDAFAAGGVILIPCQWANIQAPTSSAPSAWKERPRSPKSLVVTTTILYREEDWRFASKSSPA